MSNRESQATDKIVAALREIEAVTAGYLFGSRASGSNRRDSDVDVAVIFAEATSDETRFQMRCLLSGRIAAAAGVDAADVVDLEQAPPVLAHEILRAGRLLFSRDEGRRVRVAARQIMRYMDTAPMRRTLNDAMFRRLREGNFGRIA